MATNANTSPSPKASNSNNSRSYAPKNRSECIDKSILGYKETSVSGGGLATICPNPENGTATGTDKG